MPDLRQTIAPPRTSLPIVVFGAGSIVSDAHLPAYAQAGFTVAGIYDPDHAKASALAQKHGTIAFASVADAVALGTAALYDLAVPPAAIPGLLRALPEDCVALIQKPMGSDLAEADEIIRILRARNIRAAVENLKVQVAGIVLQKTISIGISDFPNDSDTFWQAVKFADVALYQAKDQGRNRVIRFDPAMWTDTKEY